MSQLSLRPVDIHDNLTIADFQQYYLSTNKPVVMRNYMSNWAAHDRWTLDYFCHNHGHIQVPIFSKPFADDGTSYMGTEELMNFADYLQLIATEPTQKRMFLFNIFKYVPELLNDFDYPPFVKTYLKKYPFMFFGGATSSVSVHYDLDLSHVFISQFHGRKRVILFSPKYSSYLYRHPLTVSCNVDIGQPDFDTYPRLQDAKGYECILDHGDTLFMPSGYWHYIYYLEGGFSLSLRAQPNQLMRRIQGITNIFKLTFFDQSLSRILGGKRWYQMKEKIAHRRAQGLPEY